MQMKLQNKKLTSLLLCMMLTVAMAFSTTGCNGKNTDSQTTTETPQKEQIALTVVGEGATKFTFTVVDKDGVETPFEIHTDKEIVGDALLELNLIAGDAGAYGLYVKTVNGITADYDIDQTYWAFYINDAYAVTGVDTTKITEGDHYSFKVEK